MRRKAFGAIVLAALVGASPAAAQPRSGGAGASAPTLAQPRSGGAGAPARTLARPHSGGATAPGPARPHSPAPRRARSGAMAAIPAGSYLPLYGTGRVEVGAFAIDRYPVTRAEFAAFLRAHPEWRRTRVPRARAAASYLANWSSDTTFGGQADAARPVTDVSRPAAEAYCAAQGKRLPTADEWEYVAGASADRRDASGDAAFRQRVLELYTRPRPAQPAPVGSTFRNAFGVWDLHGLVWEWTAAARTARAHEAMHRHGARPAHDMGCAASAAGATDTRNYAAFLRYAFRTGLTPTTTLASLGFRCAF